MRIISVLGLAALLWPMASSAQTPVKYEARLVAGVKLAVPAGWQSRHQAQPVPTIELAEKLDAADSPSVLLMSAPLLQGPQTAAMMAQQLVRSAMPGQRKQTGQQQAPDGSQMSEWMGPIGGIPAMMAVIHRADPGAGVGVVALFAAPVARYEALGGHTLLLQVLSGQVPGAAPPPAAAPVTGRLTVPPPYAGTTKPTLNFLVDKLETLSPAQVAQGLRQLNQTEATLLTVYGAFANLLHYIACQADPSVRLPVGAACAQTVAGWQQTLQLVGNDMGRATQQAMSERTQMQIANRCETGKDDAATCAAYTKTMSDVSRAQHETMMRMIRNMDPYSCTLGEAGCVPR